VAVRIATAPTEFTRRTTRTLHDVATIEVHDDAVDRELETQVWSMDQPAFVERLAAMQKRISRKN
jgi:enoyl-CoA hydratase